MGGEKKEEKKKKKKGWGEKGEKTVEEKIVERDICGWRYIVQEGKNEIAEKLSESTLCSTLINSTRCDR